MRYHDKSATAFVSFARLLMNAKGDTSQALQTAKAKYAVPAVQEILKSAVEAGATSDAGWAAELAPYKAVADGFLASLAPFGAMDRIISDSGFKRVPLHARIAVTTIGATGSTVGEREIKVPTKIELENAELKLRKCAAFVTASDELLKLGGGSALACLAKSCGRRWPSRAIGSSSQQSPSRRAPIARLERERAQHRSRLTLPRRLSI